MQTIYRWTFRSLLAYLPMGLYFGLFATIMDLMVFSIFRNIPLAEIPLIFGLWAPRQYSSAFAHFLLFLYLLFRDYLAYKGQPRRVGISTLALFKKPFQMRKCGKHPQRSY
ncbi:MAG: hypothetical protein U0X93_03840 [Anaerolineales bacterium]